VRLQPWWREIYRRSLAIRLVGGALRRLIGPGPPPARRLPGTDCWCAQKQLVGGRNYNPRLADHPAHRAARRFARHDPPLQRRNGREWMRATGAAAGLDAGFG